MNVSLQWARKLSGGSSWNFGPDCVLKAERLKLYYDFAKSGSLARDPQRQRSFRTKYAKFWIHLICNLQWPSTKRRDNHRKSEILENLCLSIVTDQIPK